MKVFLSHSSRQKPLVREIKACLPEHVHAWLDERSLLLGSDLPETLAATIHDSDYVVLFVDEHAVQSPWVQRELTWALDRETTLGRPFVLPIVVDEDAWGRLEPASFRQRLFLPCHDLSEGSVRLVASQLVAHLFAWLSHQLDDRHETSVLEQADAILREAAAEIRRMAHPHTKEHPLSAVQLLARLREGGFVRTASEFDALIVLLRQRGAVAGLVIHGDNVYVEEEHYGWKTTLYADQKAVIASCALRQIRSGLRLVLDAGSTTFEIARQLGRGISLGAWKGLSVVTNSVPGANVLLDVASELGLEDGNDLLQVHLLGGRVRSNTLAIVPATEEEVPRIPLADVAFVGTNGITPAGGFTTHGTAEAQMKRAMLAAARTRFVVTDPSKLGIQQTQSFALLGDATIITTRRGFEEATRRAEDWGATLIYADAP